MYHLVFLELSDKSCHLGISRYLVNVLRSNAIQVLQTYPSITSQTCSNCLIIGVSKYICLNIGVSEEECLNIEVSEQRGVSHLLTTGVSEHRGV